MAKSDSQIIMTMTCFAEYVATSERVRKAAMGPAPLSRMERKRGQRTFQVVTKHAGNLVMSSLAAKVKCLWCGDHYTRSLAPIEPHKYCSRGCEKEASEAQAQEVN